MYYSRKWRRRVSPRFHGICLAWNSAWNLWWQTDVQWSSWGSIKLLEILLVVIVTRRSRQKICFSILILSNSDIENFLLKTDGVERKPNFVTFLVWSVLIVGGSIVAAWSRISCLGRAEITSFVFLVLFKDGWPTVSTRIHLFVSDVNQGNKEAVWLQDFLTWPPWMRRFSLYLPCSSLAKYSWECPQTNFNSEITATY